MAITIPSGVVTFANQPSCTVTTGGTAALSQGAAEAWTVSSGATFPVASTSTTPATFFMVADTASTSEIMCVTVATTASPWVWNVTRGAENTTPVTHATNFVVQQVVTAGVLGNFKQASDAVPSSVVVTDTTTLTTVATYIPVATDIVTGATFEAIAYGPFMKLGGARTIDFTWSVYWGSTQVLSVEPSTGGNEFITTLAAGSSFDINATLVLYTVGTSSTTATANINFFWSSTTTTGSGQICKSSAAATTISGDGPLALTCQWSSAATTLAATVVTSIIYRIA